MPVTDNPVQANAIAIALKWWNAGFHEDRYGAWLVHVIQDIASIEHKSTHDVSVNARARVAVATVMAAKGGPDVPSGGIVNTIGGTVNQGKEIVTNIVTTPAEFLGRLLDVHLWIRVAEVIGGAALVYVGVRMLARESNITIPRR